MKKIFTAIFMVGTMLALTTGCDKKNSGGDDGGGGTLGKMLPAEIIFNDYPYIYLNSFL